MFSIYSKNLLNKSIFLLCITWLICFLSQAASGEERSARDIVARSNDLLRGKSSSATATMKVVKPDWSREMTIQNLDAGTGLCHDPDYRTCQRQGKCHPETKKGDVELGPCHSTGYKDTSFHDDAAMDGF